MKIYKIGNKIKCIIRSFSSGYMGADYMQYGNQPYTIIKDADVSLSFEDRSVNAKSQFSVLGTSEDILKEIRISNVELNDKILNLIFSKNEEKMCSTVENVFIDDYIFRINKNTRQINQVFVYNYNSQLVAATGCLNLEQDSNTPIDIRTFEYFDETKISSDTQDILIFYSYQGEKGFYLDRQGENQSFYLTLDFILEDNNVEGCEGNEVMDSYIHVDKCYMQVDKNMYFNKTLNAIDLKFIVIGDKSNYITLE